MIDLLMEVSRDAAVGLDCEGLQEAFDKVQMEKERGEKGKKVKFSMRLV